MTEAIAGISIVLLMTLFVWLSLRYFKKIGRGDAAPIIDPSWPTNMRPASPPRLDPNDPPQN